MRVASVIESRLDIESERKPYESERDRKGENAENGNMSQDQICIENRTLVPNRSPLLDYSVFETVLIARAADQRTLEEANVNFDHISSRLVLSRMPVKDPPRDLNYLNVYDFPPACPVLPIATAEV